MGKYNIAVVVGSLRRDSFNRRLASAMALLGPSDFTFKQLEIGDLSLYNQDDDAKPAEAVKRLKAELSAAQGPLFVTAGYNRSIPGVLKDAIDDASRPYGHSAWAGKPAGVPGASVGMIGTSMAQQRLRNILAYLDVPLLGQPEAFIHADEALFDEAGNIVAGRNGKRRPGGPLPMCGDAQTVAGLANTTHGPGVSGKAMRRWSAPPKPAFIFKEFIMKATSIICFTAALLAVSLAGCGNMSARDQNTATGAAVGGVAGAILTGGSAVGTVGGAAVGGVIGNKVDPNKK